MTIQSETLLKEIIETFNEPNEALVRQVIAIIGVERTLGFFARAQEVEANGGMLTANGKEWRTPGGAFFYLVRKGVSKPERKAIFPKDRVEPRVRRRKQPPTRVTWDEAQAFLEKVMPQAKSGSATIQMRLMGRPKRVARARTCMVCEMVGDAPPQLPKGLPSLPSDLRPTIGVFISLHQWERVVEKLLDFPETELIIDGWPYLDAKRNFFGIFAQIVTAREFQHLPPELILGNKPTVDETADADANPSRDISNDATLEAQSVQ